MGGGMAHSSWLLLTLFLKGVLAGDWSVHLPSSPICAVIGSSVILPCFYDYPQSSNETRGEGQLSAQDGGGDEEQEYKVLSEMWCLGDSRCITSRYVFHSDHILLDPSYQDRVQYLGQPGTKNCSLRISSLKQSDSGTYVFYFITSHPTQKMPEQRGIQLLVSDSSSAVTALASPSSDIAEGGSLRLACCSPASGAQTRFRWYKKNTSREHSGQVWTVSEVTPDESGSYYCQIQTGDEVQNSTVLAIDVQYPPRNTAVSVSPAGELQAKLPVTLTCSSDANPPVHTYTWYRGTACLPTADKTVHQGRRTVATPTEGGPTLSSANITVQEYGEHCCVARNTHGSQTHGVTLRAPTSSDLIGHRALLIGVTIAVLLAIVAIVACFMTRKRKSSRHRSYVLTQTTSTEP